MPEYAAAYRLKAVRIPPHPDEHPVGTWLVEYITFEAESFQAAVEEATALAPIVHRECVVRPKLNTNPITTPDDFHLEVKLRSEVAEESRKRYRDYKKWQPYFDHERPA
jgi:hypothetical protein